jgi:hypothetical protein
MRTRDVWRNQNRFDLLLCEFVKGSVQVFGNTVIETHERKRRVGYGGLRLSPLRHVQRVFDIDESADAHNTWEQFADYVELLGRQFLGEVREPGYVSTGL